MAGERAPSIETGAASAAGPVQGRDIRRVVTIAASIYGAGARDGPHWLSYAYANGGVVLSRAIDKAARACVAVDGRTVLVGGLPELRRFGCK